jgi:hypothetical protein
MMRSSRTIRFRTSFFASTCIIWQAVSRPSTTVGGRHWLTFLAIACSELAQNDQILCFQVQSEFDANLKRVCAVIVLAEAARRLGVAGRRCGLWRRGTEGEAFDILPLHRLRLEGGVGHGGGLECGRSVADAQGRLDGQRYRKERRRSVLASVSSSRAALYAVSDLAPECTTMSRQSRPQTG